ncbi:hypothetical protein BKA83DRAFT_4361398 [Pisolithus microcarpus]|nr:hypothetical protein BKA83DRAFT_4361398 [Pisolithus microcarpus]
MVAAVLYHGVIRFCRVFTAWHEYLTSASSTGVVHDGEGGWLSTPAFDATVLSAGGNPDRDIFENAGVRHTSNPHYGFQSYGELFVRELNHSRYRSFSLETQRLSTPHAHLLFTSFTMTNPMNSVIFCACIPSFSSSLGDLPITTSSTLVYLCHQSHRFRTTPIFWLKVRVGKRYLLQKGKQLEL